MYTFAGLSATPATPAPRPRPTTRAATTPRLTTARTAALRTLPTTPTATTPAAPQPIIVVVPQQQDQKSEAPAAPEEAWYRKSEFIGSVVSVVVLTILGLIVNKAATKAGMQ